jgi:hypothetical protein
MALKQPTLRPIGRTSAIWCQQVHETTGVELIEFRASVAPSTQRDGPKDPICFVAIYGTEGNGFSVGHRKRAPGCK